MIKFFELNLRNHQFSWNSTLPPEFASYRIIRVKILYLNDFFCFGEFYFVKVKIGICV